MGYNINTTRGYPVKGGLEMDCCKKTKRYPEEVKKLTNRLSRMEGQIRGIRNMLESDA